MRTGNQLFFFVIVMHHSFSLHSWLGGYNFGTVTNIVSFDPTTVFGSYYVFFINALFWGINEGYGARIISCHSW